jgi:nitronate monooxygenase
MTTSMRDTLLDLIGIDLPIVQAPMAGTSPPAMAAAVANAGALGSLGVGAAKMIAAKPRVVSFHFGPPSAERIAALRGAGIVILGSATSLAADIPARDIPAYPIAYDLGKALHAAGKAKGEFGFGAQWAGQGAPLARAMPAAKLVATLAEELARA